MRAQAIFSFGVVHHAHTPCGGRPGGGRGPGFDGGVSVDGVSQPSVGWPVRARHPECWVNNHTNGLPTTNTNTNRCERPPMGRSSSHLLHRTRCSRKEDTRSLPFSPRARLAFLYEYITASSTLGSVRSTKNGLKVDNVPIYFSILRFHRQGDVRERKRPRRRV